MAVRGKVGRNGHNREEWLARDGMAKIEGRNGRWRAGMAIIRGRKGPVEGWEWPNRGKEWLRKREGLYITGMMATLARRNGR
ncbi:hypothetical protein CEXT_323701 [Caerostris extrusa]|uniref:Uncharacterized protein n=1 Tax=Caerostris extrusa TaxID=172846 RepID=A0AAV4XI71_CAEEX|nr:hypothetical protein CEXT_323701 [Caerostris extrusa]